MVDGAAMVANEIPPPDNRTRGEKINNLRSKNNNLTNHRQVRACGVVLLVIVVNCTLKSIVLPLSTSLMKIGKEMFLLWVDVSIA